MPISELTRRDIADRLLAENRTWSGRLTDSGFLSRLYDLNAMRSTDYRYETAAGDIQQHRDQWSDWPDEWVFYDARFNLLHGPDADFVRFLSETLHPTVRPDADEARAMAALYNECLKPDGWELFERGRLSGRPLFAARELGQQPEVFAEPTGWPRVDRTNDEIRQRLSEARTEEHFQSVGHLSRELLISVAQAVYARQRHPPLDGVEPSATDAKRMLDAYFVVELGGAANERARRHARAAFDLANDVQHDRAATFQDAALCAEAAISVVRIVAIVSGRRERTTFAG